MPIRIGDTELKDVRVGNIPIQKVYDGPTLVWTRAVAPTMSAISAQSVAYNGNFNLNIGAITTGTAPITYSATGLPSGIAINPSTGVISGRSTNSGSHSITVTATNAAGSASRTFNLIVARQPLAWLNLPASALPVTRGVPQRLDLKRYLNVPLTSEIILTYDPQSILGLSATSFNNGVLIFTLSGGNGDLFIYARYRDQQVSERVRGSVRFTVTS